MKKQIAFIINVSIVAIFTFTVIFSGHAQEAVLQISLDETIKRALESSEELKIKENEVSKTQGVYREVRSGMLPHISGQSFWANNIESTRESGLKDYYESFGVSATQVVWSFGKVMHAVSSAKRAVEASKFNRDAGKQEIIYTAKLSYYSSLLAKNALSITEKSYANALENKKLLGQRSYGGRSPKYEIIRMNAEVAARVPTVNEARTQFDATLETLKKIIDVSSERTVELVGNFQEKYEKFNYEQLVDAMHAYEPSLKSLGKIIESTEAKVKSKFASFFPTVSAFTSWSYFGGSDVHSALTGNDVDLSSFVGLKVDIPIWEGGATQAQLSQSKADREIAILRKKQVEKELLLELKKAFLEYEQYKENLKANIEAVDLAEESFKQTQEMFASGQVTLTDLNDAELLLTNQRLNKEMTLFYINMTLAKIEKLIAGQYDEKNINKKS